MRLISRKLGLLSEFRRELEDVKDVLVRFIAEVSVQVELKWHDLQDEVLVVEQILDRLVLDEVELDVNEVFVSQHLVLALQNDRIRLPAELIVDLDVLRLEGHLLVLCGRFLGEAHIEDGCVADLASLRVDHG